MDRVVSKNDISIRLTDERWARIAEEHCELAALRSMVVEAVSHPQRILLGGEGDCWLFVKWTMENLSWWCTANTPTMALSLPRFSLDVSGLWKRGSSYGHSRYSRIFKTYTCR